jgi:hypothetical protein
MWSVIWRHADGSVAHDLYVSTRVAWWLICERMRTSPGLRVTVVRTGR